MRRASIIFVLFISSLLLVACADKTSDQSTNEPTEEVEQEEETDQEENKNNQEDDGTIDFAGVFNEVESISQGETTLIYENNEQQVHEEDEYSVSLNGYAMAEIEDFHQEFAIPFDSEDEGVVLLTHFTVENKSDEEIAYTPLWDLRYTGATRYPGPNNKIIPEEIQIASILNSENKYALEPNESASGYYAMLLRTEEIEAIKNVNSASIVIPPAGDVYEPDNYSFKNKLGSETEFTIVMDEAGDKKQQDDAIFYKDRTNTDNMGEKTMIKEKEDIGDSEALGNSTITLEGYQFTEFKPNEHEAPRFENFDTGIVLLSIKLQIENGEDEAISLSSQKAKLTLNNGKQYALHELMLSPYRNNDVIEPNSSGEAIVIFALDQEQYEMIWKDKPFELEYGPLRGEDTNDLSKGKSIEFDLPM